MSDENTRVLLGASLAASVPFRILDIERSYWSWKHLIAEAARCAQIVAEKGDVILYRSKTKGATAAAFNALSMGVACAAFSPGGIKLFGEHFIGDATKLCGSERDIPTTALLALEQKAGA